MLFDDNTLMFCSGKNWENTIKAGNSVVTNIAKCIRLNSLFLNTTKIVFMTFSK